jgi:hypothetical protein
VQIDHLTLSLSSEPQRGGGPLLEQRPPSRGHVNFSWTATDHFAAVDHLSNRTKRGRVSKIATFLAPFLVGLAVVTVLGDMPSVNQVTGYLAGLAAFAALAAIFWAVFMWQPGRRFFFRRASAVPCGLQFDEQGITWLIGKHRLTYGWSEVRSVNENEEHIFVIASRATCVSVPKSAFGSPLEADYFARGMRVYLGP